MVQTEQKTVMTPQTQHLDTVKMQQQVPLTPKVQKTFETPESQFIDEVVDVPVVTQR